MGELRANTELQMVIEEQKSKRLFDITNPIGMHLKQK